MAKSLSPMLWMRRLRISCSQRQLGNVRRGITVSRSLPNIRSARQEPYLAWSSQQAQVRAVDTLTRASAQDAPAQSQQSAAIAPVVADSEPTVAATPAPAASSADCVARGALDALAELICVIEADGTLVAVNQRWIEFAGAGGVPAHSAGAGANYFALCRRLMPDVLAAASGMLPALARIRDGSMDDYTVEYRCDSADDWRMFVARARRYPEPCPARVVILHEDISRRMKTAQRLQFHAHHDPLTQLPNRILLFSRLTDLLLAPESEGALIAVLLIDLDHFKDVNDTLGHPVGDELLKLVAGRLSQCLRHGDTVARLGGDEFAMIVRNLLHRGDAGLVAEKIMRALAPPFRLRDQQLFITASIGITLSPPDGHEVDQLIKSADIAMYRAKALGKNKFAYYTSEMHREILRHQEVAQGLRHAVEGGELSLNYQPLVNLSSGAVTGLEVLLRWNHPLLGAVSPTEFIPVAEETGMIVPIGAWVLHAACTQARAWLDAGLPPMVLSVNLSTRQLHSSKLRSAVRRALADSSLDPSLLELELTESVVMDSADEFAQKLTELKQLGVRLSLDDFGTGYSSLSNLSLFPFDRLKIDQSFVRAISGPQGRLRGDIVAKTVISLGHTLGFSVLAEGVETEEQLRFLQLHGCDEMQGFLVSRPLPAEELAGFLQSRVQRGPGDSVLADGRSLSS